MEGGGSPHVISPNSLKADISRAKYPGGPLRPIRDGGGAGGGGGGPGVPARDSV